MPSARQEEGTNHARLKMSTSGSATASNKECRPRRTYGGGGMRPGIASSSSHELRKIGPARRATDRTYLSAPPRQVSTYVRSFAATSSILSDQFVDAVIVDAVMAKHHFAIGGSLRPAQTQNRNFQTLLERHRLQVAMQPCLCLGQGRID